MKPAEQIKILKAQQLQLWRRFNELPRKSCLEGLNISEGIKLVQESLDRLGDKSERYVCAVHQIESH